mgnify:CR=1 FL=1
MKAIMYFSDGTVRSVSGSSSVFRGVRVNGLRPCAIRIQENTHKHLAEEFKDFIRYACYAVIPSESGYVGVEYYL